jgi:hypothetical protein
MSAQQDTTTAATTACESGSAAARAGLRGQSDRLSDRHSRSNSWMSDARSHHVARTRATKAEGITDVGRNRKCWP